MHIVYKYTPTQTGRFVYITPKAVLVLSTVDTMSLVPTEHPQKSPSFGDKELSDTYSNAFAVTLTVITNASTPPTKYDMFRSLKHISSSM